MIVSPEQLKQCPRPVLEALRRTVQGLMRNTDDKMAYHRAQIRSHEDDKAAYGSTLRAIEIELGHTSRLDSSRRR